MCSVARRTTLSFVILSIRVDLCVELAAAAATVTKRTRTAENETNKLKSKKSSKSESGCDQVRIGYNRCVL